MSEFEDRLSSILNDPARMEQITAMAQSLMGAQKAPEQTADTNPKPDSGLFETLNPAVLGRLTTAMGSMNRKDEKQALLEAMKPYLSDGRRQKLDRAMKLAKMIHMAELAFGAFGGEFDAKI